METKDIAARAFRAGYVEFGGLDPERHALSVDGEEITMHDLPVLEAFMRLRHPELARNIDHHRRTDPGATVVVVFRPLGKAHRIAEVIPCRLDQN
jgi:hypothetical protein